MKSFAMFTPAGNRAVEALVTLAREVETDRRTAFLQDGMRKIALRHAEVFDTAVRECIAHAMGDPSLAYWALANRDQV